MERVPLYLDATVRRETSFASWSQTMTTHLVTGASKKKKERRASNNIIAYNDNAQHNSLVQRLLCLA
eukprot:scaffold134743_cov40-Attheya_sp.AAC.1